MVSHAVRTEEIFRVSVFPSTHHPASLTDAEVYS